MARTGELMEVRRWTREHAAVGLFGRSRVFGQEDGPGPLAGLIVGVVIAVGGWVVPQAIDLVEAPTETVPGQGPVQAGSQGR